MFGQFGIPRNARGHILPKKVFLVWSVFVSKNGYFFLHLPFFTTKWPAGLSGFGPELPTGVIKIDFSGNCSCHETFRCGMRSMRAVLCMVDWRVATSRRRPTLLATTIDSRTCFFMIFIGCPLKKQEGWHDGIFGSCNKMLPWKISIGVRSFQKALQISINIIWWHKIFMFPCHKPTSQRNVLIMFSFSSNVVP